MLDDRHNHLTARVAAPPPSLSERVRSLRLPEEMERATAPRSIWLPWALCGVFAALSGYLLLRSPATDAPAAAKDDTATLGTTDARPASASPADRLALAAGGYVIPVHRVQVSPKVGGEVVALFIEEG